ncbi:MAG: right-handed parallel beta-helix repeat-containing protein [Gemmatimonadaceae bacterium]|nr:right-handed parallel beta-helix repeat-containing protein [Chitinophagaceae bacterium]
MKKLYSGVRITSSAKILPQVYRLNAVAGKQIVIEVEGDNLVIDFNGAIIDGNIKGELPDKFTGVALYVKKGKNIVIKNLTARGFKIAIRADNVSGLKIENCNLSYNYRQRLNSSQQKEDVSDWMSFHHNDKDEWLRYGAAVYLKNCDKAVVRNNIVTGGQCALMISECDDAEIFFNDFSYNSAIGIGLYRSNRNKIIFNRLDFNIRGYSHGVYQRGQDSAAILVFEQCNGNVFMSNSATHSGDGFFLWAGQYTMDSGMGGCNDNRIYFNNFSWAATNGIEATFSRNKMVGNIINGCDHGIWAGYSFESQILLNSIGSNRIGIAIEHGQQIEIAENFFEGNGESIRLWGRATQPVDWGYTKKGDLRSNSFVIHANHFKNDKKLFNFSRTDNISLRDNKPVGLEATLRFDSTVKDIHDRGVVSDLLRRDADIVNVLAGGLPGFAGVLPDSTNPRPGRREIRMTEWGPYDFRSPLIWLTNPADLSDTVRFELVGPPGAWRVVGFRGLKGVSGRSGIFPSELVAIKTREKGQDIFVQLEYTGGPVVNRFGKKFQAGQKYLFEYRDAVMPISWKVNWFAYDSTDRPLKDPVRFGQLIRGMPILRDTVSDLNYAWWGGIGKELRFERFITVAESAVDLPTGEYELSVSWDDAVRLYVDGRRVVDEWQPLKYKFDEAPNRKIQLKLGGRHQIRAEHVESGGFATLVVKLKKT